ncbi:MAG: hypothetical protein NXH91_03670 [Phyllobacteriaceae bacterium]|nr:hypothetical protein [Phyllobacteriaceae bacterium]
MGMLIDGIWCAETDRYMHGEALEREVPELPSLSIREIAARLENASDIVLVVSQSCPWSYRTTMIRALKGVFGICIAAAGGPRVEGYALSGIQDIDPGATYIRHVQQIYTASGPAYRGRATMPVLWDKCARKILANSSAAIARALDRIGGNWRLAPVGLAGKIDDLNKRIYDGLANAV